jgi:hypothetical protein
MPFGNLIAGSLAQAYGVATAVAVGGTVCALFMTVIVIRYPEIRKI